MTLPFVKASGDGYEADIGDHWLQGRTAFGGASAAIALTAIKHAHPDLPPLRSMQAAFVGPVSGAVRATPQMLRQGKNSAFVGCDVRTDGGIGLRTLFLFMASRPSAIAFASPAPPPHVPPDDKPVDSSNLPQGFLTNFDLAHAGRTDAGFVRWARLKDREGLDRETELVVIADALPPAAMALAKEWGPISTTTWQVNLVTDQVTTRDGWWLLAADTLHAGNGSSSQSMTIWNRDGQAVATATQSVALFV